MNARTPTPLVSIAMIAVQSSTLSAIGYDEATATLQVDFTDNPEKIYQYRGVEPAVFEAMLEEQHKLEAGNKGSVGSIFYRKVKDKIAFTRFNRATGEVEKEWAPDSQQDQGASTEPQAA